MQLSPRYGTDPVIVMDGPAAAIAAPVIAQRRRLAATLEDFGPEQWSHPSRCEGWTNRDVIIHLDSTNTFWQLSIDSGLSGEPTRFLASFDPVTSPADLVDAQQGSSSDEVCAGFRASTDALCATLEFLDDAAWSALAEAPPGHLAISEVAHHALWDSWVHERDILVPLGIGQTLDAAEVAACLRYVAALGPAMAINHGRSNEGSLLVTATDPDLQVRVDVGKHVSISNSDVPADFRIEGDAATLVDAFSLRGDLAGEWADAARWLLGGLADAFDLEAP